MTRSVLLLLAALWTAAAPAACPPAPVAPTAEQAAAWAAQAPDRGLLWRISRDGRSSYLFGSLHLGKADWAYPGPALRRAWAETEVLAVELDPADVGDALATLSPAALAALPVMLQLSTLTLLEARRDGFDPLYGQDQMLLAWAKRERRPVQSLESVDEQLAALEPEAGALADLIDSTLRQLQRGQMRAPLRQLAASWSRGDLKALADYPRWCACADTAAERAWLKRVNDDRNTALAARIDALHAAGQRLLVAVGALHMSGPEALPRLLAARGFEVKAVLPSK